MKKKKESNVAVKLMLGSDDARGQADTHRAAESVCRKDKLAL